MTKCKLCKPLLLVTRVMSVGTKYSNLCGFKKSATLTQLQVKGTACDD